MVAKLLELPELELDENSQEQIEEDFYPVEYRISSYGADYDIEGLVRRMKSGDIEVPNFQRGYVWRIFEASRFIESLLLGLPVPSIFLARDANQKLLVIDGQQRLRTLQYFYKGVFEPTGAEFSLKRVQRAYEGLTYDKLDERDRRKLDNAIIHTIIVEHEGPEEEAPSSIYHLFERLNSGAVRLKAQEVRTAVYHGRFSNLMAELNRNSDWRSLLGPVSKDLRDQELILRFFALLHAGDDYERPMTEFLNKFMRTHRSLALLTENELRAEFQTTVAAIWTGIGEDAFRRKSGVNAALCDAVMLGVARRLAIREVKNLHSLRSKYDDLVTDADFQNAIETATTNETNVVKRHALATKAFGKVR